MALPVVTKRFPLFLAIAVLAALVDQFLKQLMTGLLTDGMPMPVAPFLDFRLVYNPGISFGMFADLFQQAPWLLASMKLAIVLVVAMFAWRSRRTHETVAYGLIAGGAMGNILDRVRLGSVIDYIDVFVGTWHWPVFNAADCLLLLGIGILLWAGIGRDARRQMAP